MTYIGCILNVSKDISSKIEMHFNIFAWCLIDVYDALSNSLKLLIDHFLLKNVITQVKFGKKILIPQT